VEFGQSPLFLEQRKVRSQKLTIDLLQFVAPVKIPAAPTQSFILIKGKMATSVIALIVNVFLKQIILLF